MARRKRHGKSRGQISGSRSRRPKLYKIACASCGREIEVQVRPPEDRKLLCMECFKK